MERDFKGVWIPKEIWVSDDLGWTEKLILTEIDSLAMNGECFASNEYFAEFFKLSKDRISKLISSLKKKGFVEVKQIYKPGTKQIEKRVITTIGYRRKQLGGIVENTDTPIGENNEDINTSSFNNTSSRSKFKYELCDMENAEMLKTLMLANNPTVKIPENLDDWANEMRKLRKLDKKTVAEIRYVIQWCQHDSFWSDNILSARKLREKWDTLYIKAKKNPITPYHGDPKPEEPYIPYRIEDEE